MGFWGRSLSEALILFAHCDWEGDELPEFSRVNSLKPNTWTLRCPSNVPSTKAGLRVVLSVWDLAVSIQEELKAPVHHLELPPTQDASHHQDYSIFSTESL